MKDPTISPETETIQVPRTTAVCKACENYATAQLTKPVVVLSCEGGCSRGEVARRAANMVCFELAREQTARLCLGAATTKDSAQRKLARSAQRLIAIEGCSVKCATRLMLGVVPNLRPEVVVADDLYEMDPMPYGIDELSATDADACARKVADRVAAMIS